MLVLPTVITVGHYFDKKQTFAIGLSMCGEGIGTFAIAPLANFLRGEVEWRYAHYIYGKQHSGSILVTNS